MRNPDRIPAILNSLAEAWELEPDWRLGQLLTNISGLDDMFYLEEEELQDLLEEFIKKNG